MYSALLSANVCASESFRVNRLLSVDRDEARTEVAIVALCARRLSRKVRAVNKSPICA